MAASGPKAIELAGEIADGVMLLVGFHRGIVDAVLTTWSGGRGGADRRLEDLEIVWAVRTGLAATTAEARRQARPTVVHQGIMRGPLALDRAHRTSDPARSRSRPPSKIYPDLSHAHDWEEAIAATSFVPDEVIAQLCDAMGLVGHAADCARRIVEMTGCGVQSLYIMALETFVGPERELRAFRDEIFPRLQAAGYR